MSFIGRGEATVSRILAEHCGLEIVQKYNNWHVGNGWFCPQVPFADLVPFEVLRQFDTYQQKTSVDFIARVKKQTFAIYVNGPDHDGRLKNIRDRWRYEMLKALNIRVIIVAWQECVEIFHEVYSEKSIKEFEIASNRLLNV